MKIGKVGDGTNGETDEGRWWLVGNATPNYTLSQNKTVTLTFSVGDVNTTGDYNGYVGIIRPTNSNDFADFFVFLRAQCDYCSKNVWNSGAIYNADNYPGENNDEKIANRKAFLSGSTVVMTLKRLETIVMATVDISKSGTTYRHYYVQDLGTTDDVYVYLAADHAVLTITDGAVSDSEPYPTVEGKLVGGAHNGNPWWSAFSDYYTIAPNKSMKLKFKNYTNKLNNFNNFVAYVTTDADRAADGYTEYFGMRSDNWVNVANQNCTSNSFEAGFNWDWNAYKDKMDGATIDLTITRTNANVTVRADITPSDAGTSFYEEYTKECGDGTQNIRLFLVAEGSHLDILPESIEIGATGWGTYVSEYNLDFSQAEDGLTAYKVTGNTGTVINKEKLTGIVPAGTPMLLSAETASETYTVPVATSAGTAIAENCLKAGKGAQVNSADGYVRYVMVNSSGTAKFKKIGTTGPTINTNRAYLEFASSSAAHELLSLDGDDVTAIKNIKVGSEDNVYYNLNGQRVLYPTKGLYIVNGKKVIIK